MRGRDDPMQSVRRSHVDAAIEESVDESRVLCRIGVLAVVSIIVDGVAASEVNLKHRAKPLNDRVNLSSTKNITQTGDGGIADRIDLLVNRAFVRRKQIQIRRDHAHGEPVAIEGSVMQHHIAAPTHTVENRALPRYGANRKPRSQGLAERAEVRCQAVMLLASAGCVAESGHNFVQNKQRAKLMRQVADLLQISIARQDATHVRHDRLGDHGGQVSSMPAQNTFKRFEIVPWCKHYIVERKSTRLNS